eukprot:TRINITY_DN17570_c0_g4_i3.p1 TRINITY_DN17570_c0_g4~~TRINITY_DN17570_c0_g4_i3.p1  ORF type:complete len:718 (+),score=202.72 TRINITY_DN17570_c0_g4_i3:71-2224(+)
MWRSIRTCVVPFQSRGIASVKVMDGQREDLIPKYALVKPENVKEDVEGMLSGCKTTMAKVEALKENEVTWENAMTPFREVDNWCNRVWGAVSHISSVNNTDELRKVYNEMLPEVVKFELEVKQNKAIYQKIVALKESKDFEKFSAGKRRTIQQIINDARFAGLSLEGDEKEEFNKISSELSLLSTNFKNNVIDEMKKHELLVTDASCMDGVPDHVLEQGLDTMKTRHPDTPCDLKAGPWCFTLDLYHDFMKYCKDRDLRKTFYMLNITKASTGDFDNSAVIEQILKLRKRKAQLLGFKTHAELSLAKKMAPSVDVVLQTIEEMRVASLAKAKEEVEWLKKIAGHDILPWDVTFFTQQLKEKSLELPKDLVNYFPLEKVMDGLFKVVKELFKVDITLVDTPEELSWDEYVRLYEVKNLEGEVIAKFFVDPYARPGSKKDGAWMSGIVPKQRNAEGKLIIPSAHIVCNASKPVGGKPALLSPDDVVTLFHECGHCLQHILSEVEEYGVSGIEGIEWDAVELPSQFMENWFYLKKNLKSIGCHWETGEPLSEETMDNLTELKYFCGGLSMLRQMALASVDMRLHHEYEAKSGDIEVFNFYADALKPFNVIEKVPEDRMLCSFSHIFAGGYSAGYYSYMWAEILSSDAFGAFEDAGLDNPEELEATGKRFRDTVLALGGSVHPSEVFRMFRGRDPTVDAVLRHNCLGDYPRPNPLDKIKHL